MGFYPHRARLQVYVLSSRTSPIRESFRLALPVITHLKFSVSADPQRTDVDHRRFDVVSVNNGGPAAPPAAGTDFAGSCSTIGGIRTCGRRGRRPSNALPRNFWRAGGPAGRGYKCARSRLENRKQFDRKKCSRNLYEACVSPLLQGTGLDNHAPVMM
jgi:hypothetical protein